ncbi:MAG: 1-(5-phosphoribosyl)-5-[(5-phosphoribosylamino)methylideneamino]imidazole-4-carboxamide isomerase [Ferruginibacter sp.]
MTNISSNTETTIIERGFILPAIDIIEGKAVRLTQGDFKNKKVYYNNPLEAAKAFEAAGLTGLHLVDLDGAKAGKIVNIKVLDTIANHTSLKIDFGGGVKNVQDVKDIINAGASLVTIGSLAVKQPTLLEEWVCLFGSNRFFIGADVLDEKIKINGWLQDGGMDVYQFLMQMQAIGIQHFFCTDIQKDGAMQGASVALYQKMLQQFAGLRLTASGGVSSMADIEAIKAIGCNGAIIGKAIYEGLITLQELQQVN